MSEQFTPEEARGAMATSSSLSEAQRAEVDREFGKGPEEANRFLVLMKGRTERYSSKLLEAGGDALDAADRDKLSAVSSWEIPQDPSRTEFERIYADVVALDAMLRGKYKNQLEEALDLKK